MTGIAALFLTTGVVVPMTPSSAPNRIQKRSLKDLKGDSWKQRSRLCTILPASGKLPNWVAIATIGTTEELESLLPAGLCPLLAILSTAASKRENIASKHPRVPKSNHDGQRQREKNT